MRKNPAPALKPVLSFLCRAAIAGGLIFWLIRSHCEEFRGAFRRLDARFFLAALALYAMQTAVCARRWQCILRMAGFAVRFPEAMELTMKGCFCSLFIPGGPLGGDVGKIGFLAMRAGKGRRLDGALTILLDRILGMIGLFLLALALMFWEMPLFFRMNTADGALSDRWRMTAFVVLAGTCLAGLLAVPLLLCHGRLRQIGWFDRLFKLGDRWSGGIPSHLTRLTDTARAQWHLSVRWILYTLVLVHGGNIAAIFCIIAGLGLPLSDPAAAAGMPEPAVIPLLYSIVMILFNLAGGLTLLGSFGRASQPDRTPAR